MPAVSFSAKDLMLDLVIRYGFQVAGALVILALGWLLGRWLGGLTRGVLERRHMEPPMVRLTAMVVQIVVLVFTVVIALEKFGFSIAPLVAGIGVAGLGLGIALQGVPSNVVAGLTIIFTKPYRVGEYIELLEVHGDVVAIELFSTTLVHPDRSRVVIPNRKIVGEILHNFGSMRQLDLSVAVGYETDLGQALALVAEVVAESPRVLKEPPAVIGVARLDAPGIQIAVRPWVKVGDIVSAQAELNRAIAERLRLQGIAIGRPIQDVRLFQAAA